MIPYKMGGYLGQQFNWFVRLQSSGITVGWPDGHLCRLYEHISSMWNYEGWLPEESVEFARAHYAAYTVKRPDGLRIISIDTDMCKSTLLRSSTRALLRPPLNLDRVQRQLLWLYQHYRPGYVWPLEVVDGRITGCRRCKRQRWVFGSIYVTTLTQLDT